MPLSQQEMEARIVRYGELKPCRTAFIDAHTPGSNQKENFTIIGGGVSESPDQHVHIKETPGFNIGAAGQPPKCRNSLHSHRTAEVFFVLKGRWRYLEHDWVANEGDYVFEPPGETHTLTVPEDVPEMVTFFNISGCMYYVDEAGRNTGFEDVFTKIDMCRAHYEAVGLGGDYVDRFIR